MSAMMANDIQTKCTTLQKFWMEREKKFKDWYQLLTLFDKFAQENMESFVGNDPRTFWNMSKFLLTPRPMVHRILLDGLTKSEAASASNLEEGFTRAWGINDRNHRRRGRGTWWEEFVGQLTLLGWYSVFVMATPKELIAEIWNPAHVFPKFGESGLIECSHIYPMTAPEANKLVSMKEWAVPTRKFTTKVNLYDWWILDDNGEVNNAIVIGDHVAKDLIVEPSFNGVIPIICGPVGGIPDDGTLSPRDEWKGNLGQSIFATDEKVYQAFNKLMSFMQQLMRDTAQARWVVKTRSPGVVKPADIFKRGAVFEFAPDEDMYPVPVNPIPIELKSHLIEIQGMIQRGSLSWLLFGNIMQEISAYTMSQVANSSQQVLDPYHQTIMYVASEIDNRWKDSIIRLGMKPLGIEVPQELPEHAEFDAIYKISIPGDLLQRANAARMLSPNIKFSQRTIMDTMFPEIKDPVREIASANADDAMMHPAWKLVSLVRAFEEQAKFLTEFGDTQGAQLFQASADNLKKQMMLEPVQEEVAALPPGEQAPTGAEGEVATRQPLPRRGLSPI